MDKLARDAVAACQIDMSYGKYKAMQAQAVAVKPEKVSAKNMKKCENCGKEFELNSRRKRKYCGDACREEANQRKSTERRRARKEGVTGEGISFVRD